MSKSEKTYELEEIITLATSRPNRIGCAEVTLDDWGIVDFIAMDLDGKKTVRCYELKISKSDFLSDAKKTFIGNFNYYVIPSELWQDVKGHIENGIGVWVIDKHGTPLVRKKASYMECKMDKNRIMGKILRALNRENMKHCEQSWMRRQLEKRVPDFKGSALHVGDVVSYRDEPHKIISIEYESNDNLSMTPTLTIAPVNELHDGIQGIRSSIVKKIIWNNDDSL